MPSSSASSPPCVVLTGQRASPLDGWLRGAGRRVVHIPLLVLVPTLRPPPDPAPAKTVLLSSSAAVRFGGDLLRQLTVGRRVCVVGERTAQAAHAAGIEVAEVADGSGVSLLALIPRGEPAVFVGAARPALAMSAALAQRPALSHWAVYDRSHNPSAGRQLRDAGDVAAVAYTSPAGVGVWVELDARRPFAVAIGGSTARALVAAGFRRTVQAERPTPRALFDAMISGTKSG